MTELNASPGTIVVRGREILTLNWSGQWMTPGMPNPMPAPDADGWTVIRWGEPGNASRDDLATALREELAYLWGDLADAYRLSRAEPPETSLGCENVARRIHAITRLTGPTPPDDIEMPFLLTGMYERVHAAIGIKVTVPEGTMARARERKATQQVTLRR